MEKPKQVEDTDLQELFEACQEFLDFQTDPNFTQDRANKLEEEVFEVAMETVFGKDVWKYVNGLEAERLKARYSGDLTAFKIAS